MSRERARRIVALCAVLVSAAVVCAQDPAGDGSATDAEVGNRVRVLGHLEPAGEIESLRLRVPRGATLSVKARSTSGGAVQVRLRGPDGLEIDRVAPRAVKGGVRLRDVPIDVSGLHRVEVRSGTGDPTDYDARIEWRTPTRVRVDDTAPPGGLAVPVAAEAGARIDVRLGKGVEVATIAGPDGSVLFTGDGRKARVVADATGLHVVTIVPTDGVGVPFAARMKIGRIRGRQKLDLAALEQALGAGRLVRRLVDGAGGTIVAEPLGDDATVAVDVSGAGLDVPPGSVTSPVSIDVRPDADITPPRSGLGAAGVAVEFDDGDGSVTGDLAVTVPFDAGAFADGTDDLVVVNREDDGTVTEMTGPFDVDADAGVVHVPTSHLSSYQVFRRARELVDVADVATPTDLARGADGALYVVALDGLVRRLPPGGGALAVFAGGGARTDDGAPRESFLFGPLFGVAVDGDGAVLVSGAAAGGSTGDVIHRIAADGTVTRIAGDGRDVFAEGVDARVAGVPRVDTLAVTASGDILLGTDEAYSSRILRLAAGDGTLRTVAGRGDFFDEGVDPLDLLLPGVRGVTVDDAGRLLLAASFVVTRVDLAARDVIGIAGEIDDVEGSVAAAGQGAPLRSVAFGSLTDVAFADGDDGIVYAADATAEVVWRLDLRNGRAYVAAGRSFLAALSGAATGPPVGGRELSFPIAVESIGSLLYIADLGLGKLLVLRPAP